MADEAEELLKDLGSKLETPPSNKDSLLKLLKQGANCLSDVDQSPANSFLETIAPFINSIVGEELLSNPDKDVKLLVAACACEVTRITAPNAPYSDDVLKDVFRLIVDAFDGLGDILSPSFGRRVTMLENLAKFRSCVVMLDLECYDLVKQLFSTFLNVISDDHQDYVLHSINAIMVVLIEESEEVRDDLILVILSALGRNARDISNASRKLAMKLIEQCAGKFEPGIKQLITASASRETKQEDNHIDYHEVIYDVYRCAPQILAGTVPFLVGELLNDQLDIRLKTVELVGDLFALPGSTIMDEFQPVFSEFLKRLTDRVVEVRMAVLGYIKRCLLSNPFRPESPQIVVALCDRLMDYDENIRKQVVDVICCVACHELESISDESIKLVAERLRDKSLLVKRFTIEKLAEIYRVYCTRSLDGSTSLGRLEWIPGKIFRCFYDKDFRSDTIELFAWSHFFPHDFSVQQRNRHWVRFFSLFEKVEVKALEKMLEQKQRIQQEMQRYLSLRQSQLDGDAVEIRKKLLLCIRHMSRLFADPVKAEECFQTFDQLKDVNIWKIVTTLLESNLSFHQACNARDELLKLLGVKHKLYDFLNTLSVKCSFLLINKDHVKELLLEATKHKLEGSLLLTQSCMDILVIVARNSPFLFCGVEEELVNFLKDENEILKEGALHILAEAGGAIRDQLPVSTSSMDLMMERLCLEGSRRQAKFAVQALAAIEKDDGLKSLSVLYKGLVDMLVEHRNLPAILQSLGCIAQTAAPIYETRENEITDFIRSKIFMANEKVASNKTLCWEDRSESCLLKIYAIKSLVKGYLPTQDVQLRPGINDLFRILRDILTFGEAVKDLTSSSVDKAHMRLAAAKAILRLSKLYDREIPVDLFHLTLKTGLIEYPEGRKIILEKVHHYIKDRHLDLKYACIFLLEAPGVSQSQFDEVKQYLLDIIQMCQQTKTRQYAGQSDANMQTFCPEYIIPYCVHAFAHLSCPDVNECKDVKAFESIYRRLHLFFSLLIPKNEDAKFDSLNGKDNPIHSICSILKSIKNSEDIVDVGKTKNSHGICDLGLSIIKSFWMEGDWQSEVGLAPLPAILYKSYGNEVEYSGNTWLTNESVVAHFKIVKTEDAYSKQEIADDREFIKKEGPLLEMMEHKKYKGNNEEDSINDSQALKLENAVGKADILKIVREIQLDDPMHDKFESSNGHRSPTYLEENLDVEQRVSRKTESCDIAAVPIPKRRRTTFGHLKTKTSQKSLNYKGKKNSDKMRKFYNDLPLTGIIRKKSNMGKILRKKSNSFYNGKDHNDREVDDGKARISDKLLTSHMKKRKLGMPGLMKCTTKSSPLENEELIGKKIKVWWPIDKKFYVGTIKSYDALKGKHVILYEDGDVEVLRLDRERWELIETSSKPKKKLKLSKGSTSTSLGPESSSKFLQHKKADSSDGKVDKRKEGDSSESRNNVDECDDELSSISKGDDCEVKSVLSIELAEDEPLCLWKHKVGKLVARGGR